MKYLKNAVLVMVSVVMVAGLVAVGVLLVDISRVTNDLQDSYEAQKRCGDLYLAEHALNQKLMDALEKCETERMIPHYPE